MKKKVANVILVIATAVCFYYVMDDSSTRMKDSYKKQYENEKLTVQIARDAKSGGYSLIMADELNVLLVKSNLVLIDTLPEKNFKKNHIKGAINFPFPNDHMEKWDKEGVKGKSVLDFKNFLGKDNNKLIIFYSNVLKSKRAHNGAMWAKKIGYTNVIRLCGGIYSWRGAGFVTEKSGG